jgi:hypothetical protein
VTWDDIEPFRRMYFAAVHEAWMNLPEHLERSFINDEQLRKWALVKCGYANEQNMVLDSVSDALRYSNYLTRAQPNSFVRCEGEALRIWTAKSQAKRSMTPEQFKDSANAVLEFLSAMIGTRVTELRKNAGRSA